MMGRLILDVFGTPPLRPDAIFMVRQGRREIPVPTHQLGRPDRRQPVLFLVGVDGRACFKHGIEPSTYTVAKAQQLLGRRFCGERA